MRCSPMHFSARAPHRPLLKVERRSCQEGHVPPGAGDSCGPSISSLAVSEHAEVPAGPRVDTAVAFSPSGNSVHQHQHHHRHHHMVR